MAKVIRALFNGYRYFNDEVSDPRTKDYFLISTPWPGLLIVGAYLHFVFNYGPKLMENRQPFKLERIMQLYNIVQIILCGYLCYMALTLAWLQDYNFSCQPVDFSNNPRAIKITHCVWLYFIVKLLDLMDTVFFVLRKKYNQISFLHVYHHVGMAMGSWGAVKYLPGGHVTFLGLINCFVHMVMYTHYLLTSLKLGEAWWKKYITQLQLIQFCLLLIHYSQLIWVEDCGFPRWPAAIMVPQNLFMIILFCDFYYKAYIKKPQKSTECTKIHGEISNGRAKTQ